MQGGEGEGAAEGGNWWEGRPLVLVLFLEGDKEGQQLLGLLVVPGPCCHSLSRGSLCMRCPWPTGLTAAHPLTQTTLPSSNLPSLITLMETKVLRSRHFLQTIPDRLHFHYRYLSHHRHEDGVCIVLDGIKKKQLLINR